MSYPGSALGRMATGARGAILAMPWAGLLVGGLAGVAALAARASGGGSLLAAVAGLVVVGLATGMNDAGLTVADLSVTAAADVSPQLDPTGTPYTLLLRRMLEECGTVAEAEKLIRGARRTVRVNGPGTVASRRARGRGDAGSGGYGKQTCATCGP